MSKYCPCRTQVVNCIPNSPLKYRDVDGECCGKGYCGTLGGTGSCNQEASRGPEKIPDKLIFVIEWYESQSELVKKYLLIYYGVDGMCEVKDMINQQRFVHRLKLDTVTLDRLYLGNIINIYGRQMAITEYADSCTRQLISPRTQRAFLLIKPDAVQCLGRILQEIEKRFKVLRARMAHMTPQLASLFYQHYGAEEFYSRLVENITSGPVVAFLLVGENAIERLQCLIGDPDSGVARLKDPSTLRAIYGKDRIINAFHVSETPGCVEKDASMFFTDCRKLLPSLAPGTALMQCSTCCIIKPHAVEDGNAGKIVTDITAGNFTINAFELFYLDRTHADEFYEIYKGVLPEYSLMTEELALGKCYVLEISGCKNKTIEAFREYTGPMEPSLARKLRPQSLRAKYGKDKVHNAVHCTDLECDAVMEVEYFFHFLQM